ncbi:hypothetical protein FA10DRAFT_266617 [Acaromyces ingoldii]|uniref:Small-subunit processome n=1 Tax=Acaromyces ingoldii TaxID=215250 RepID=A0A316YQS1_9BASI|nr:hypothetical protein FA10DRAFT_266617 [Acaromyces ingoldii]PWN90115.1 hypothetical protein FA10DRAFT_266617 [Acaromyces ingoldii]
MALRNAVHRRNHKERSQPQHRAKMGLLEKHKDYVQRARDHHSKQDRLQRLRQKAAMRNADEFNFGMLSAAPTRIGLRNGGMHHQKRTGLDSTAMENGLVALLKTQDEAYVRMMVNKERKRIEDLVGQIAPTLPLVRNAWLEEGGKGVDREETLVKQGLLQPGVDRSMRSPDDMLAAGGKKTVWLDDVDEVRAYGKKEKKAKKGETRKVNEGKEENLDDVFGQGWQENWSMFDDEGEFVVDEALDDQVEDGSSEQSRAEKHLGSLVAQLSARQKRLETLQEAQRKLSIVRAIMTTKGTTARKIDSQKQSQVKEDVLKGKLTPKGLALPGQGSDDEEEEDEGPLGMGPAKKPKRSIWKWGKERKK